MDARELHQFKDNSFSLIIDKGEECVCVCVCRPDDLMTKACTDVLVYLLHAAFCSVVWCGAGCLDAICCGMNLYESTKRYCEVRD